MTRTVLRALASAVACTALLLGCSSSSSGGSSGSVVCCLASNGQGVTECGCQPPGTISQGGITSTLTVNGSSCTFSDTFGDASSTTSGSVVSACGDGG